MLKQLVLTIGTAMALTRTTEEPIEFAVSLLEKVADQLEKAANFLEENIPQKEK